MMIQSSVSIVLLAHAALSIVAVTSDKAVEEFDSGWHLPKLDPERISLSCVLFSDVGCDAACYVITSAYGLLGTGICDSDNTCDCNFAMDTTIYGIWERIFPPTKNENIQRKTEADSKLSRKVHRILLDPFQTGQQIKQKLDQQLPGHDFNLLRVSDSTPASKMFPTNGPAKQDAIITHVNEKLPQAVQSSSQKLSDIDYKSALKKIMNNAKQDQVHSQLLLLQIRRIGNKSLNSVLQKYPQNQNEATENTKNTHDIDLIIDQVIDKLVNEADKPFNEGWVKWLRNQIRHWVLSSCFSFKSDFDPDLEDPVNHPDRFQLPPKIVKQIPKELGSIDVTWRGDGCKIRYHKGDKGDVNLNWIKRSIRVSILRTDQLDINQNWNFRSVKINITRTSEGHIAQSWDFGEYTYQHEYANDGGKGSTIYEKWSDDQPKEQLLVEYTKYIDTWCQNNDILIDRQNCIIYKP